MRLWPKNMVGQLLLAVALTLFVAQSANLWLLDRAQRQQFIVQVGGVAAARIYDMVERERRDGQVLTAGEYQRGRLAVSLTAPEKPAGAQAMPALAEQVGQLLSDNGVAVKEVRAWRVTARIRQRAGRDAEAPGERRLPLRAVVAVNDGKRWIIARGRAPAGGDRLSALLIGQTLLLYLLLLVPILLIGWRVSRPLNELTASVRRARPGDRAEPLRAYGPADVHDLMAAFNEFRGRIDSMMTDKDRMLGAVGHDLRTPLASLRVRVEQVDDAGLRDKMIASIDEMAAMLSDILALARSGAGLEAGQQIRLGPWLDALVGDYAERSLAVVRMAGDDQAEFFGRPILLARALRNLIDNALTYGEQASVRLAHEGAQLAIIVTDNGPGIDADKIGALLEPFARGEASRNRATGGSGLGLTLAKSIAEGEGGALRLRNRRDASGLEASIVLPI